jgi:hypothetical protein
LLLALAETVLDKTVLFFLAKAVTIYLLSTDLRPWQLTA